MIGQRHAQKGTTQMVSLFFAADHMHGTFRGSNLQPHGPEELTQVIICYGQTKCGHIDIRILCAGYLVRPLLMTPVRDASA